MTPLSFADSLFTSTQTNQHQKGIDRVFHAISEAAARITLVVKQHEQQTALGEYSKTLCSKNIHDEQQAPLDVLANDMIKTALLSCANVAAIASEEETSVIVNRHITQENVPHYFVAFDPIDGSSNIDTSVPVGSIFSIYSYPLNTTSPSTKNINDKDFLRKGREQLAAAYIIYGLSTWMVCTVGQGVKVCVLNAEQQQFVCVNNNLKIPNSAAYYSVNDAQSALFPEKIHSLLAACKSGSFGAMSARYTGSLIVDIHRNLLKGGIFLYPSTVKRPCGKLRLLYECNPLAFIIEQAGGAATDGCSPILDIQPETLHQTVPFYAGNSRLLQTLCLN